MLEIKLKALLVDSNMTLKELSKRTGLCYVHLSRFSSGKRKMIALEDLRKICDVLYCQISDFIIFKKEN